MLKGSMDKDKDYKRVFSFLKRVKPAEQKVLNALKIFDKEHKTEYQQNRNAWKWVCYYKMCELLERPGSENLSLNHVAINFVKGSDYIRWSNQMKIGLKGKLENKARMFREHYTEVKKIMDSTRAKLKKKKNKSK